MADFQNGLMSIATLGHMEYQSDIPHVEPKILTELFNRLPIGLMFFKQLNECVFWNAEASALLKKCNYAPKTCATLSDVVQTAFGVHERLNPESVYVKHFRHPSPMHVEFSVVELDQTEVSVLMFQDVSDRFDSRDLAEQLDALLVVGEIAAGVAHEIRNPLASIRGFTQMLRDTPDASAAEAYLAIMLEELDRVNGLVEELLRLARPKSFEYEQTDLVQLVDTVALLLNSQAILKSSAVRLDYDEDTCPIPVLCQSHKIKQVFINVIKNAIEASPKGKSVVVSFSKNEDKVAVCVIDEGPGIPKEHVEKIGQRFFTTKEHGTGLGLAISQDIMREHAGSLSVERSDRRGTVMKIELPCVTTPA